MKIRTLLCLAAVSVGFLVSAALAADDLVEFKVKHRVGEQLRFRITTKSVGSMTMPAPMGEQKFSQTFTQEFQTKCTKVNADASGQYETTFTRIAMNTNSFGTSMKFDSAKPLSGDNPKAIESVSKIFTAMTGFKFNVTISADGRKVKVVGFADGMKKALKAAAGDSPGPEMAMLKQMQNAMSDELISEQIEANNRLIPKKKQVKVGEKWKASAEMKLPMFNMDYKTESEYELLGIEKLDGRNCAKIRVTEEAVSIPLNSGAAVGPFAKMKMTMSIKDSNGLVWWDIDKGCVVRMRQTQNIEIDVDATDQDSDAAPAVSVKQKLHNSVSLDLLNDKDKAPESPSAK